MILSRAVLFAVTLRLIVAPTLAAPLALRYNHDPPVTNLQARASPNPDDSSNHGNAPLFMTFQASGSSMHPSQGGSQGPTASGSTVPPPPLFMTFQAKNRPTPELLTTKEKAEYVIR